MFPRDIPPFASYILSPEGQSWTGFEFDIIVGNPRDPGPFFPPEKRRQAMYLGALKIDCVAWFHNTPTIIEAKPDADLAAVGQVLVYRWWYEKLFSLKPSLMVVANFMTDQIQEYCFAHDIALRLFPDAGPIEIEAAMRHTEQRIEYRSLLPGMQPLYLR